MNSRNDSLSMTRTSRMNFFPTQTKRSNSAKVDRMPPAYPENRRSTSARVSRQETLGEEGHEENNMTDLEQIEHKVGCPWRKARSLSKSRYQDSNTFLVHPKPWGARNPSDIPCFCRNTGPASRTSRSPTRIQDLKSRHEKEVSKAKMDEVVASLCSLLERKKLKVSDYEMELFFEILKEKIQKYKESSVTRKDHRVPKQEAKHDKHESPHARKAKTVQSLVPSAPSPGTPEHPVVLQQQPMLGKMESKKYYVELRAEEEVPPALKQMLGMMNPQGAEKQFVLMDSGVAAEGIPQYAVLNTGVLRHHEENTMVLLGNQRIASPVRHKPLSLALPNQGRGRRS